MGSEKRNHLNDMLFYCQREPVLAAGAALNHATTWNYPLQGITSSLDTLQDACADAQNVPWLWEIYQMTISLKFVDHLVTSRSWPKKVWAVSMFWLIVAFRCIRSCLWHLETISTISERSSIKPTAGLLSYIRSQKTSIWMLDTFFTRLKVSIQDLLRCSKWLTSNHRGA